MRHQNLSFDTKFGRKMHSFYGNSLLIFNKNLYFSSIFLSNFPIKI